LRSGGSPVETATTTTFFIELYEITITLVHRPYCMDVCI
jgi:hypothetical protein